MATHSSVLAWRTPGTREPGGLPSMGSHRVRHDWSDLAAACFYFGITLRSYVHCPPQIQCLWRLTAHKTHKTSVLFHWKRYNSEQNRPSHPHRALSWAPCAIQQLPTSYFTHGQTAAAAAAKSLQSCLTLCDPIDGSPPGPPIPGILQARTLEWVAISFSNAWKCKVKVKSLSCVRFLAIR